MDQFKKNYKTQLEFIFSGEKSDTLVIFGFLFYRNTDGEIQCMDLVENCLISSEFTKSFTKFNKYQELTLKHLGFGDYRNQLAKSLYKINLNKWPKVTIVNKISKEIVEIKIVETKSEYYNYLSKFDLRFTKFQFCNIKDFKNYIKLNFMNINLITPENMVIFEDEIKKAIAFGISSYARELYSELDLLSDVKNIKEKIENAKTYVNNIIKTRKECANLDLVEKIKNQTTDIDGTTCAIFKKLYKLK